MNGIRYTCMVYGFTYRRPYTAHPREWYTARYLGEISNGRL